MGQATDDVAVDAQGRVASWLVDMAERLALGPVPDLELIRRGTNTVLVSLGAGLVFRLHRPSELKAVEQNLALISELAKRGCPVAAPACSVPATSSHGVLTSWPRGEPYEPDELATMGAVLAHLHATSPVPRLPWVEVTTRFDKRLSAVSPTVPPRIRASLERHALMAEQALRDVSRDRSVLVHGDAHIGNLVRLAETPVLIDLDDLSTGPREFDLVPSCISYRRFHRSSVRWQKFKDAYGPCADWHLVERLCVVREATMNTWLAGLWDVEQRARDELRLRVDSWDLPWADHPPWSAV